MNPTHYFIPLCNLCVEILQIEIACLLCRRSQGHGFDVAASCGLAFGGNVTPLQ
jgi:hypothetical protein